MKNILLSFFLLTSGFALAQNNIQFRKDSLQNVIAVSEGKDKLTAFKHLMDVYFMETASDDRKMDTLVAIYNALDAEALRQKDFSFQGSARLIRIAALKNRKEFAEVLKMAPDYLAYLAKHAVWDRYYDIYRVYLEAFLETGEYGKALDGAQQMYKEAQQREHVVGKGHALYLMSFMYSKMNRHEEEEKYIRECIDVIKDRDDLTNLIQTAYFRLGYALEEMGRYDEALQQVQEYEKIIGRHEEIHGGNWTYSWINVWRLYTMIYAGLHDFDKVEIYCDKIDSIGTPLLIQHELYYMRAQLLHNRKQYDKALEMTNKAIETSSGNPFLKNESLNLKLTILCAMRNLEDILALVQQTANLSDSIRSNEFNARLDELRTVYEVDKITAEKIHNHNYFLFALGGCLLLAITLGIWIFYSRTIVRKNKRLYSQIKEQDRLAEELEAMRKLHDGRDVARNVSTTGNQQQRQLVDRLHEYLLLNKNFLNPEIERDELVSQLTTNKTYLFDAVKAVTGKSLQEFINALRLEEVRRLFDNHSELNIEAIAADCGFNTYQTFYRLFKKRYKLSPAEYAKLAKSNDQ